MRSNSDKEPSESEASKRYYKEKTKEVANFKSYNSSSSSDSDEQETGRRQNYTLEKRKNKIKKKCENKRSNYTHRDEAINDAHLLSDLRKPTEINRKTDIDGKTLKKSKLKKLSPILFVRITYVTGKKNRQTKTKMVKALVDTGATESIINLKAAKHLPLSNRTETKKWSTAADVLNTNAKTKRLEFSLPELHTNRTIKKSFHVVNINLKNYDMIIGRDLITSVQPARRQGERPLH